MSIYKCRPASHIFIAIPSYLASLQFDTAYMLAECLPRLMADGITVSLKILEGNCYVDLARCELVADFLASDATDLLFIDSDVGAHYETLLKICRSYRPVVGAIYPKKTDDVEFPVDFLSGAHPLESDGTIEVSMIATGMMRINRAVFDVLKPKVQAFKCRGKDMHAYFQCDVRNGTYYGEDIEFCRLWREAGGKLYVFPNETLSHTGPHAWIGNLQNAIRGGKLK